MWREESSHAPNPLSFPPPPPHYATLTPAAGVSPEPGCPKQPSGRELTPSFLPFPGMLTTLEGNKSDILLYFMDDFLAKGKYEIMEYGMLHLNQKASSSHPSLNGKGKRIMFHNIQVVSIMTSSFLAREQTLGTAMRCQAPLRLRECACFEC